jgi:hypothetical protein
MRNKLKEEMKMIKMFSDYKTMVSEPKKEFKQLYRKEIILLNVIVFAAFIGGNYVITNRKSIKEKIKSKFNRGKRD